MSGKNTPPRNANIRLRRIWGDYSPMICPGSLGQSTTWYKNTSGEFVDVDRYDSSIPLHLIESFQSGLSTMQPSVSSIFDIQSRFTISSQTIDPSNHIDNGTGYRLSQLRPIQSLITGRGYSNRSAGWRDQLPQPYSTTVAALRERMVRGPVVRRAGKAVCRCKPHHQLSHC